MLWRSVVATALLALVPVLAEWRPITFQQSSSLLASPEVLNVEENRDQCALYKVSFVQDLYFQYIQYKTSLPDMKEFTLCMWHKFYNHSNDHPLFSYAVSGQPRAIYLWVSNTPRSSYFSLSVESHTFFRLNYPLRLNRWYHSCTSWNGNTGEWQIWINAERVGRGFHNRLVGHVIRGGGIAITGQEQRQYGGGFLEGPGAPKGSGGMLGEVTQVYLYKAALAAGKAHKDHKHHHGNKEHSTEAPPSLPSTPSPFPAHPLFNAGQLIPQLDIPKLLAAPYRNPTPSPAPAQLILPSGGDGTGLFSAGGGATGLLSAGGGATSLLGPRGGATSTSSINLPGVSSINIQHNLFKRNERKKRALDQSFLVEPHGSLLLGGDFNPLGAGGPISSDLYDHPGVSVPSSGDDGYPREPAEGEVMQVMNVCSGCDPEPFKKAELLSWRTTPKKLYSGALYTLANPECRRF